jgi:hypothetical protein
LEHRHRGGLEALRQMRADMEAFGLNKAELKSGCCDKPANILGLPPLA